MKASAAQILAHQRSSGSHYRYRTVSKAASDLGRLGGLAGGPARADKLSDEERRKIAIHAANIRWGNHSTYP